MARFKQSGGVQSAQERDVKAMYPHLEFKPERIPYVSENDYYPDFKLGTLKDGGNDCYLELKEYIQYKDVAKYEWIMRSNPHIRLYFLVKNAETRTLTRLAKSGKVHVGYKILPAEWMREIDTPLVVGLPPQSHDNTNTNLGRSEE